MDKFDLFLEQNKRITTNHDQIKSWIENRGGKPAIFDDPTAGSDKQSLRIDFPGKNDEKYMQESVETRLISWEDFFERFENERLAFIYLEVENQDDPSWNYKFIKRDRVSKKDFRSEIDFS